MPLQGKGSSANPSRWRALAVRVSLVAVVVIAGVGYVRWQSPRPLLVPTVSSEQVLQYLRDGKKVIFVDSREPEEYVESRIPGAINLSLRELESASPELRRQFSDADLVIAYCLKDFRGFEVARALRALDVQTSSTLAEQGINGWKARGLPVTERGKRTEAQALAALAQCAATPGACLKAAP